MFLTIDTLEKVLPVAVEYIPLFIRRKKLEVTRILDKFKQAKEIEKVKQYSRLLDYLRDNPQELAVVLQEFPAEVREHILGKKPKMMKKGGAMPPESLFFRSAKQSYKAVPERELAGFELVVNTPTCKVYKKDNVILIGLRGTDIADKQDLIADASLAINRLSKTERYKKDKATLERLIKIYPPQDNEYYLSGHSLSGAIINQLKYDFPFLRNAVEYNPAFQVKDLIWSQKPDIKRIYTDKDGLYRLGGRLFAKNTVIPAQNSTGVDAIDAVSGHILSNFASLYPEGGNRIFSRSTYFNAPAPAPAPARPSNPTLPHKKPHAKMIDLYDEIEIFKRLSIFSRLAQTMSILAREGYIELRNAEGRKLDPKTYFAFVPVFSVNPSKFTQDEFYTLLRDSLKEIAFSPEEFDRIKDVPISSNYFTNIYQVLFPQRERVPEPVVERNEVIQPNLLNPEVNPPASIWRQEAIDAEERAKKQGRITRFGRGGSSESDEEAEELRLARQDEETINGIDDLIRDIVEMYPSYRERAGKYALEMLKQMIERYKEEMTDIWRQDEIDVSYSLLPYYNKLVKLYTTLWEIVDGDFQFPRPKPPTEEIEVAENETPLTYEDITPGMTVYTINESERFGRFFSKQELQAIGAGEYLNKRFKDPYTKDIVLPFFVKAYRAKLITPTGSGIHRKRFFKRNNLPEKHYSLRELSKISAVPLPILQEVYNRGIGAYKTNPTSVRLKGSYVKGVDAPRSKKLSKEQWAFARVYSFLDGNQKHDNDLRGGAVPPEDIQEREKRREEERQRNQINIVLRRAQVMRRFQLALEEIDMMFEAFRRDAGPERAEEIRRQVRDIRRDIRDLIDADATAEEIRGRVELLEDIAEEMRTSFSGGNEEEDQRRADEQIEAEARDLHHLVEQYYRDENPPVITPRQEEPFSSPFQERRTEKQLSPVQVVDIPTIEEPMRQPKFEDSPKRKRKATAKKPKAKGGSKMSGFVKMLYAKRVLRKKPTDYTPAVRDKKAPAAFLKHKIKKRSKHLQGLIGGIPTLNRPFRKGERETLSPKELEELRRLERERKRKSVQNKREKAWNALTDKQRENLLLESNNNLIKAQNKALKLM
jgi:hypothetical protein